MKGSNNDWYGRVLNNKRKAPPRFMHYLDFFAFEYKMHTQGNITLSMLFTTLNYTNWKIGAMQEARKTTGVKINILAINKAISTQDPIWRWSTKSTTIMSITCHGQGVKRDIYRWYIGMIFKTNFTTNKHMAKDKK